MVSSLFSASSSAQLFTVEQLSGIEQLLEGDS
jgi:hypothetical protein